MATATSSFCLMLLFVSVAQVFSEESPEISQSEMHHQAQKRSTLIEPVDSEFEPDERQALDAGSLFESPYEQLSKRGSLFRFGKRGSLFRFGKRGGSLFRFGKRGGTLFRFGRSGAQNLADNDEVKRNSLFRFGKRAGDSDLLEALEGYNIPASYAMRDVDSKRNLQSFHWGESEK